MSIRNNSGLLRLLLEESDTLKQRLPKLLCAHRRNPIHLAALEGMNANLEPILQNLNAEMRRYVFQTGGIDRMTPLHLIAKRGHLSCLDLVTPKGESLTHLTTKDVWGRQALHLASSLGSQMLCSKLLMLGARSDQMDDIGKSSIDYFVESKRRSSVKRTVRADGASTEPTILKESYLNEEESKEFCLFAMQGPSCRYSHERTFLHSAVQLAIPSTIEILLNHQFDLEARDDDGRTPLHYAVLAGRLDMTKALINGFDFRVIGSERKHIRTNLSAGDFQGTTALMFAARENFHDIGEALLSKADRVAIDQPDGDGKTALFYAADLKMIRLLVERNCNTTVKSQAGRTRLHTAIDLKQKDIALYLLQLEGPNQVQDNPYDNEQESLLITASRSGLSTLVEPILKRWGSILDEGDSTYNQSPLAWACEEGHTSVVEKLLTFEVDVNRAASKFDNLTPLHFSVWTDKKEIFEHLFQHKNIDLSLKDTSGRTALESAVRCNSTSAVRELLLHDQTAFSQRVKALKRLIPTSPERTSEKTMALVSNGLKSIGDKEQICEFLVWLVSNGTLPMEEENRAMEETTTDAQEIEVGEIGLMDIPSTVADHVGEMDGISADAHGTQAQRSMAAFLDPLITDITQQGWESIGNPYDLVMLLGDNEFRETVKGQQLDGKGFDGDMWSCVDYIERFDRKSVMNTLVGRLKRAAPKPEYMKPAAPVGTRYKGSINLYSCISHSSAMLDSCNQVHGKLKHDFTRMIIVTNTI